MGDMADWIIDNEMFDLDDAALRGEIDEETGQPVISPFCREFGIRPSGNGPCPTCGGKMHKCKGKYGEFWGCDKFPKCKGNRRIQ